LPKLKLRFEVWVAELRKKSERHNRTRGKSVWIVGLELPRSVTGSEDQP
jgi:hypothetical protein